MIQARRAFAIPSLLVFLILVIPLVFSMALRSRSALAWYTKVQDQKQAMLLANEGESSALAVLRSGGTSYVGSRRVPRGGMEYRIASAGTGDAGQALYTIAGEGVFQGEERMLLAQVEVFGAAPNLLLLEHDRVWIYPGQGGGSLVRMSALAADLQDRVSSHIAQLGRENSIGLVPFLARIKDQSLNLHYTTDVAAEWASISNALKQAKCQAN